MAFPSRAPEERPQSMVFRPAPSQPDEYAQHRNAPLSPLRSAANANATAPATPSSQDARNSLQRRFTTNAMPSLAPIGEQRGQQNEAVDTQAAFNRMSATEKKARQYEALLAQQRRIQAQMALIDPETRREVDEARKLEQDISLFTSGAIGADPTSSQGPNPATKQPGPAFSNRFSTSSLTSPSAGYNSNRQSRTSSQLMSPPIDYMGAYFAGPSNPSASVPGSQRNSDHDEESEGEYPLGFPHVQPTVQPQSGANPNRNSLPVTAFDHRGHSHPGSAFSPNPPAARIPHKYFGDDEGRRSKRSSATSPEPKTFLTLHQTDDQFPILLRRGTDNNTFSGTATPLTEDDRTEHNIAARHRQSLPPTNIRHSLNMSGLDGVLSDAAKVKGQAPNRHSMEANFGVPGESRRPVLLVSPQRNSLNGLGKPASSYSANDVPTLKSINNATHDSKQGSSAGTPAEEISPPLQAMKSAADIHKPLPPYPALPTHDPEGSFRPRSSHHSSPHQQHYGNGSIGMGFDAVGGAVPYPAHGRNGGSMSYNNSSSAYGGMHLLTDAFGAMQVGGGQQPWQQQPSAFQQGGHNSYQQFGPTYGSRYENGSHSRPQTGRRATILNEEASRIANTPLTELIGEIYGLCKDQHGCRFLQKKLEERDPENIRLIFDETLPHVVELMTDPFGNYLCQKLLEYTDDEQRTRLIKGASPYMVKIALNQHGTRALQKMIEFITMQEQINIVIHALKNEVVQLIQDLNGNHVIQKCLNHLSRENVQFIVDAVCIHVVTVGTHRHGCCVLQRCVDHASGLQKGQLVNAITNSVFALVQDPFGNYVVQYILDLGEPNFSEPLCRSMAGSVTALACQKFSSNVMEKSLRVAKEGTRRILIREMIDQQALQKMLRDSFANYVVQTAMDYADEETKALLYDAIRPIMPGIRHTPHGRRIASKIQEYDDNLDGGSAFPRALSNGGHTSALSRNSSSGGRTPFVPAQFSTPAGPPVHNGNSGLYSYAPPPSNLSGPGPNMSSPFGNGGHRFPTYSSMGRPTQHNLYQY